VTNQDVQYETAGRQMNVKTHNHINYEAQQKGYNEVTNPFIAQGIHERRKREQDKHKYNEVMRVNLERDS